MIPPTKIHPRTHYPASQFFGYDNHDKSIEHASAKADRDGLDDRVSFEVSVSSSISDDQ